jgi:hypothetical protein
VLHFIRRQCAQPVLRLTASILVLQAVEHDRPFHGGLTAERHLRVFIGDFQQRLAEGSPASLGEPVTPLLQESAISWTLQPRWLIP